MTRYKVDLHTHSIVSRDGGITEDQYEKALSKVLDVIAITDHNSISFALKLQKKFKDKIIVGEEIETQEGEIIGLYLSEEIFPGGNLKETIQEIHEQRGIVYVPHPFETLRRGIKNNDLIKVVQEIDILEVFNARAFFRNKNKQAFSFAEKYAISPSAASDAHVQSGLGSAYVELEQMPRNAEMLMNSIENSVLIEKNAPFFSFFGPSINRLKGKIYK